LREALAALAVLGAILVVAYVSADPAQVRAAVALALVFVSLAVGLVWPERLLYGLAGWLVVLGLVRRLVSLAAPVTSRDPLLVVEPLAVAVLIVALSHRSAGIPRTRLSTAVAVMSGLIGLSALNPKQGGPFVGLAGLLFLLVPTLGFWVGRTVCTDEVFRRLLKLVAALAVPVAVYGLVQTFVGFPRWDEQWIQEVGQSYQALNVGSAVRPFASLPSSAEYAYVLAVGLVVWLVFGFRAVRLPVTLAVVGLLGTALVFESSRLVVFLSAAALIAVGVSRLRLSAPAAAVVVLLSFVATSAVVGKLAPNYQASGSASSDLVGHQLQGLANPLQTKSSTFFIHLSLVTDGIKSAVAHPVGVGAGAVSLAAGKFGSVGHQSEADPSNLAIAAGIPGLATYLVVAVLAFIRTYSLARRRRDALSLSALAIVTIVFLQWFNGGQYGIALLLWVTLGWIDRASSSLPDAPGARKEAR
jgi:hypothetical protein